MKKLQGRKRDGLALLLIQESLSSKRNPPGYLCAALCPSYLTRARRERAVTLLQTGVTSPLANREENAHERSLEQHTDVMMSH